MTIYFQVDEARIGQATQLYLKGLFTGLFVNRRFTNTVGTVAVAVESPMLVNYVLLVDNGVYQVFFY